MQSKLKELQFQLSTARNEINNLRQQVRSLTHVQRKDIEKIATALQHFRCEACREKEKAETILTLKETTPQSSFALKPIGVIRTSFPEKRAVPRQASVGGCLRGLIELNSDVFTNPEHALKGLEEYSHIWLIYYFHKNTSHSKAKVAPPRLDGERVGVFATRSPHRPCPIGLSLVEIEKIEGTTISFFGTDMTDNTPLVDIKPYIPHYDAPFSSVSVDSANTFDFYGLRQEPDGEESQLELLGAASNHALPPPPPNAVKVPNWIVASHRLKVLFNERAEAQLLELQVTKKCITDILGADPRSVYLRTRYGSQIFTFQLSEVTVTCKFDDRAGSVTVVQIRRNENVQDDVPVVEQ